METKKGEGKKKGGKKEEIQMRSKDAGGSGGCVMPCAACSHTTHRWWWAKIVGDQPYITIFYDAIKVYVNALRTDTLVQKFSLYSDVRTCYVLFAHIFWPVHH